jgi:branched-chain amino acid transport system permease protein
MIDFPSSLLVQGAILGSIYSFFTIGFSLVYGVTEDFHFAHGGVVSMAGYAFTALFFRGYHLLSVGLAIVLATSLSLWTARIYRSIRDRGGTTESVLIASFVLVLLFDSLVVLLFGTDIRNPQFPVEGSVTLLKYNITYLQIAIVASAALLFTVSYLFLVYSKYGFAMRATADNETLAQIVGVDTATITGIAYVIAAISGAAGIVLVGMELNLHPGVGLELILKVFVATVIGGIGSFRGAFVGAYSLGYVETATLQYLPTGLHDGVVFALLIVFLLFRPRGLLGTKGGGLLW